MLDCAGLYSNHSRIGHSPGSNGKHGFRVAALLRVGQSRWQESQMKWPDTSPVAASEDVTHSYNSLCR
jgi:hypothetical protein